MFVLFKTEEMHGWQISTDTLTCLSWKPCLGQSLHRYSLSTRIAKTILKGLLITAHSTKHSDWAKTLRSRVRMSKIHLLQSSKLEEVIRFKTRINKFKYLKCWSIQPKIWETTCFMQYNFGNSSIKEHLWKFTKRLQRQAKWSFWFRIGFINSKKTRKT